MVALISSPAPVTYCIRQKGMLFLIHEANAATQKKNPVIILVILLFIA